MTEAAEPHRHEDGTIHAHELTEGQMSEAALREQTILANFQNELGRLSGQLQVEIGHRQVDKKLWEQERTELLMVINNLQSRLESLEGQVGVETRREAVTPSTPTVPKAPPVAP